MLTTEEVVADAAAVAVAAEDGAEYVKVVHANADADVVSAAEVAEVGRMTVVAVHTKVGHTRYEEAGADCNGLSEEMNGKIESRTSTS